MFRNGLGLRLGCYCCSLGIATSATFADSWGTVVFRDDFEIAPGSPDPFKWVINHPGETWWTQGRTHFPEPLTTTGPFPRVERLSASQSELGALVIEHHTHNPWDQSDPNHWFLGGEVHSILEFDAGKTYRIEARVRLGEYQDGLVTSFFTFGHDGCASDEIDFEFVSKLTNDGGAITTNTWNEGCQSPRCPCLECVCDCPWVACACEEQCSCSAGDCLAPANLDLTRWNTFRIYWYPDQHRVVWTWLADADTDNEIVLRTETDVHFIPDEPMSVYFNFWAADETWGCAFDGSLKPVNDPGLNHVLRYEIDYVEVRELARGAPDLQFKLTADDAAAHDEFGSSVSVSNDTFIAGAASDDDACNNDADCNSGAAYVFVRSAKGDWRQQQKLVALDAARGDWFGGSVAVDGDTALVSAPSDDDACPAIADCNSGSVYVFERSEGQWSQQQKLSAQSAAPGDYFGASLSIDGDIAVIGAVGDSEHGAHAGAAYVFVCSAGVWSQQQKLVASDAADPDDEYFGVSVSVSGSTIVVGAYQDDDAGFSSGSAYVFVWTGVNWVEQQKLSSSDAARLDRFGVSVSVSGDIAVIGAEGNSDAGATSGSAYVFVRSSATWTQQQKLTAMDASKADTFGHSVSVSGDTAVVGAVLDEEQAGPRTGSVYVYRWSGKEWTQRKKLRAMDGAASDYFGWSISIEGETVVAGALFDDDMGESSGAAYVFSACKNVDGDGTCDSTDVCTATPPAIMVDGDGRPWGDIDGDCDTDLADFQLFQKGFTGTYNTTDPPVLSPEPSPDQVVGETTKLVPSEVGDEFGWSTSVSADVAIVGARRDDYNGAGSGAAFVFRRNPQSEEAWPEEDKLLPSDGAGGDEFGVSVSISEDLAIVGAHLNNDLGVHSGSAYIFRKNGSSWVEEQKLLPSDGAAEARFGRSVSVFGEWAAIGSPGVSAAYVFRWNGSSWIESQKLEPDNGSSGDGFGFSISLGCRWLVVGAELDDDKGEDAGAAYVYRWNGTTWSFVQKLTAEDGEAGDAFGLAVTVHEDSLIVGAPFERPNPLAYGSAYAFRWNPAIDSWVEEKKLLPSDTTGFLVFGISVSVFGNTAIVGAPNEGFPHGAAYVFRRNGADWRQIAKLSPSDSASFDRFGWSVAVSDGVGVVGAFPSQSVRRHAYLFSGICEDFDGDRVCNSVDLCQVTLPGTVVDNQGRPSADIDDDCDADLGDARRFQEGFTGPGGP